MNNDFVVGFEKIAIVENLKDSGSATLGLASGALTGTAMAYAALRLGVPMSGLAMTGLVAGSAGLGAVSANKSRHEDSIHPYLTGAGALGGALAGSLVKMKSGSNLKALAVLAGGSLAGGLAGSTLSDLLVSLKEKR